MNASETAVMFTAPPGDFESASLGPRAVWVTDEAVRSSSRYECSGVMGLNVARLGRVDASVTVCRTNDRLLGLAVGQGDIECSSVFVSR